MMKTIKNPAIFLFLLITGLIFISFNPISNQQKRDKDLLAKANILSMQYPNEKIYLHLDRPSYFVGEDIWFKAYLLNSPIPNCNLYIELVNSSGEIIDKKINWAQNGLAYGDFYLNNSLSSGLYQIRAYTNWMRNFDDSWFFRKDLIIWNRRDNNIEKELAELHPKNIDLQFFPESGTLLANMENTVAFKAVDKNGRGISVEGEIVDEKDEVVAVFKSSFKGIGKFRFVPQEGKKYEAHSTVAGNFYLKTELPAAKTDGIKLAIEPNSSTVIDIQISVGSPLNENKNGKYQLIGQTGGQIFYRTEITPQGKTTHLELEKRSLPTGIVKFTLFDSDLIPQCERLVFINHCDHVEVEIVPEKLNYLTREKVQFDIKTFTNEGIPCLANLSMSVFNSESSIETETYPNNILTQFLFNSELKGTIEDPAWYFKDDSLTTLQALDNLMLTHGYRYFDWEEIRENKLPEIKYQPEASLQLKGKVSNWLTKRPIKDCKVTMMSVKSLLTVNDQITDSLGNFVFTDLFFYDTVYVTLQAGGKKERKNFWLELDYSSAISPQTDFLPVNYRYNENNRFTTSWYLGEINSDLKYRKWHLNDTILLGDINIVTKKREFDDGHNRPYLDADYVLDVLKEDDIYTNIFELIENTSPYMRNYMLQNPTYYLDGVPVDTEFISDLPSRWFDKIEAVRMAPKRGGFGPALYFYTNRGETQTKDFDGLGMKAGKIIGYSVIRKFYSPVYESRDPGDTGNDFRNTLYWNPIVRTDSTGVAQVSFYNSDETGTMKVVVEGITSQGKLCRGLFSYEVKN